MTRLKLTGRMRVRPSVTYQTTVIEKQKAAAPVKDGG
jgi:hypothetical protein